VFSPVLCKFFEQLLKVFYSEKLLLDDISEAVEAHFNQTGGDLRYELGKLDMWNCVWVNGSFIIINSALFYFLT